LRLSAARGRPNGPLRAAPCLTAYSIFHLVGDVVALIQELGAEQVAIVGHDWGSIVASNTAVLRPDVVRGLDCTPRPSRA
jgi:pimeloyl-ACP methyl ester carboxylesterase